MHETPIVFKIVGIAEHHAKINGANKVNRLVIQIGELSDVIPDAVKMCFPMCIEGTMLDGASLEIETIPAIGVCRQCSNKYNLIEHEFKCPKCQCEHWEIITGRELLIKEIEVV